MTKDNSSEEIKTSHESTSTLNQFKKEVGPIGFIGAIVGLIVIVGAAAIFFLDYKKDIKNDTAQNEIFQAQYYYENDSIESGLLGDGRSLGFLDIIEIYSGTEVANLAHFYAGASYLKQRNYAEAIEYLEKFSTSEEIVQARANKLLGDAYMEQGNFTTAGKNYMDAAETVNDEFFSPGYLLSASLAYEKSSDLTTAVKALEKIITDYKESQEYTEARKHKARLEVLAGN